MFFHRRCPNCDTEGVEKYPDKDVKVQRCPNDDCRIISFHPYYG